MRAFFLIRQAARHPYWPQSVALSMALLLGACTLQTPLLKEEAPALPAQPVRPTPPLLKSPASPAASEIEALRQTALFQDRLDRVAAPLLLNNAGLCKRHARNLLGLTARNKYSYLPLPEAASQVFGLEDSLQVSNVMAGSGADRMGVQRGDILVAVNGRSIPKGPNAENEAAALLTPIVAKIASIKLTIQRDQSEQTLIIPLTRACGFWIEIGNSDSVNSYSDGRRILITRGMADFAKTDDELALAITKEMAHNVLGHARMLKSTTAAGDIIDNLVRIQPSEKPKTASASIKPMPQQYDIAADTLSLQMAVNGGYDIGQAVPFWQRLATQYPSSGPETHTAMHPASAARLSAMQKAIARIKNAEAAKKAQPSSE